MSKRIFVIFQTLVSMGFLIWIFWRQEFRDQIWRVLAGADERWLLAGFATAGVASFLGVLRWNIFLRIQGISLTPWEVIRISFVGLFFNNFLFGSVGGDVVKVVWLGAKGYSKFAGLVSVLMDRISGFPPMLFLSLIFLPKWLDWSHEFPALKAVPFLMLCYLGIVSALLIGSMILARSGIIARLPEAPEGRNSRWDRHRSRVRENGKKAGVAYGSVVTHWRQTLLALGVSVLALLSHFSIFYCCARAFSLRIPLGEFFAIMPVVDFVSALPVSLGGFGIREEVFVQMMAAITDAPKAQVVSLSLAGALLLMMWGLFGLAILPSYRQAVKRTEGH